MSVQGSQSFIISSFEKPQKQAGDQQEGLELLSETDTAAFLEKALSSLEGLQPFDGNKGIEALDWLQKLKGIQVTADILKGSAIGKRMKAFEKHAHDQVSCEAKDVVRNWKGQLLQQ